MHNVLSNQLHLLAVLENGSDFHHLPEMAVSESGIKRQGCDTLSCHWPDSSMSQGIKSVLPALPVSFATWHILKLYLQVVCKAVKTALGSTCVL